MDTCHVDILYILINMIFLLFWQAESSFILLLTNIAFLIFIYYIERILIVDSCAPVTLFPTNALPF